MIRTLAAALATTTCIVAFATPAAAQTREFNIPAGSLRAALDAFARQSGRQVIYRGDEVRSARSPGVRGSHTAEDALDAILAGTGFMARMDASGAFAVTKLGNAPVAAETAASSGEETSTSDIVVTGSRIRGAAPEGSPIIQIGRQDIDRSGVTTTGQLFDRLPQNFRSNAEDTPFTNDGANLSGSAGVNIRGLGGSSTLVLVDGRRLPLGGGVGASYVDITSIPLSAVEKVEILTDGASAIYGSDAVAGVVNFILRRDFEGLESSARIGAVTDGGMAEYQMSQVLGHHWRTGRLLLSYEYYHRDRLGYEDRDYTSTSDLRALGGTDFRNTVSSPGNIVSPVQAAIPPGQDGTALTPGALLVGQQNRQNQNLGRDLLPAQDRHSVFLSLNQQATDIGRLFADVRFSRRSFETRQGGSQLTRQQVTSANPYFVTPVPGGTSVLVNYNLINDLGPTIATGNVTDFGTTVGLDLDVGSDWQVETYALYETERTNQFTPQLNPSHLREALGLVSDPTTSFNANVDGYLNLFGEGDSNSPMVLDFISDGFQKIRVNSDLWMAHAKADGTLFRLPGGNVRLAIGAEYREESLYRDIVGRDGTADIVSAATTVNVSRQLFSAFGELLIPLVSEQNAMPGVRGLAMSLAGRYDHYSDFGSAWTPKVGARWTPVVGFDLRGSYSRSFKAPSLAQEAPNNQSYLAFEVPDPASPRGATLGLFLQGNNPGLGPERSTAWTVGADFHPSFARGLRANVTYFDVNFRDRIGIIGNPFTAFSQPALFAPIIVRNPNVADAQAILNSPFFDPSFGLPAASDVEAIVDGRLRNLASTRVNGIDFTASYDLTTSFGQLNFSFNGSYLLEFKQRAVESAPQFELVDTVRNPIDFRARFGVAWSNRGWTISTYADYADSYRDTASVPERKIGSWTTIDATIQYDTGATPSVSALRNLRFTLAMQNLFDQDPPFVNNVLGVGYDRENASPLGRFISLQVSKRW